MGGITVVSGKSFQINYDAKDVQVLGVQPNKEDQGLIFSIQATGPISTLELTLPRELIDAPKNDGSSDFIILLDNAVTKPYVEKSFTASSRTILIQLVPENKELEIIGTRLAGSENGGTGTTQIPTTTTPQQTNQTLQQQTQNTQSQQNQTSNQIQKSTEIPSEKPMIYESTKNLPLREVLSKIFHFNLSNLPFNVTGKQLIEYSVMTSEILILIVVIVSSKKSKTRNRLVNK